MDQTRGDRTAKHKLDKLARGQRQFARQMEKLGHKMEDANAQQRSTARWRTWASRCVNWGARRGSKASDISRQMHEAGKPIDALGKQMEVDAGAAGKARAR